MKQNPFLEWYSLLYIYKYDYILYDVYGYSMIIWCQAVCVAEFLGSGYFMSENLKKKSCCFDKRVINKCWEMTVKPMCHMFWISVRFQSVTVCQERRLSVMGTGGKTWGCVSGFEVVLRGGQGGILQLLCADAETCVKEMRAGFNTHVKQLNHIISLFECLKRHATRKGWAWWLTKISKNWCMKKGIWNYCQYAGHGGRRNKKKSSSSCSFDRR